MVNTSVGWKCVVKIKINDNIEVTEAESPQVLSSVNGEIVLKNSGSH